MIMARLYANGNFPQPVVQALRVLGHEVLTVLETGKAEQAWPDDQVLEFARQPELCFTNHESKALYPFARAATQTRRNHRLYIRPDFSSQARRNHEAIQQNSPLAGKLVRIYRSA
jgi:hypothetical protein